MSERGRILGIGGIFFKAEDAKALRTWYAEKLGIDHGGHGKMFPWRSMDEPAAEHLTIWSIFSGTTKYFEPSKAPFMMNYIVDYMDAYLEKLRSAGVSVEEKQEDLEYGRFAWVYDPEGNKIELWQPPAPAPSA